MKRREFIDIIYGTVEGIYEAAEARAIAFALARGLYGITRSDVIADPDAPIPEYDRSTVEALCERLAASEPLQYVLGETQFCGLDIGVAKGVLIPRPETEELVEWICRDHGIDVAKGIPILNPGDAHRGPREMKVLDIGTGSGAIAVALSKFLPVADVTAMDVSTDALRLASANASRHGAEITFVEADILASVEEVARKIEDLTAKIRGNDEKIEQVGENISALSGHFDVIVSNPPYIPVSERDSMHANVKEWEPDRALFVSDSDPLLFYREIVRKALLWLRPGGALYFEVHENWAAGVCDMMRSQGFSRVECRTDINDKPRMVKGIANGK